MARTAIEDRYYELHPKSAELYERAKLNFPKGVTHEARNMSPFPVHMTHGSGSRKWDVDGIISMNYGGDEPTNPEYFRTFKDLAEKSVNYIIIIFIISFNSYISLKKVLLKFRNTHMIYCLSK